MSNEVSYTDVTDSEFVDARELASDGYSAPYLYRTLTLVSTSAAGRQVVVTVTNPYDLDRIENVDEPVEVGDFVKIRENAAAGSYVVESIVDSETFTVVESIPNSVDGYADMYHPSGASRVGFDPRNTSSITSNNLQDALEELDAAVADGYVNVAAECVGQVFFSVDGLTFQPALPITSSQGWLVNDQGLLIVGTCEDGYC